jgi:hypothetical protein
MASSLVCRANRPNTWLHRPACKHEEKPCQRRSTKCPCTRRERETAAGPEGESRESSARADQQRFLQLAQGDRRVRGLVAEGALRIRTQDRQPSLPTKRAAELALKHRVPGISVPR